MKTWEACWYTLGYLVSEVCLWCWIEGKEVRLMNWALYESSSEEDRQCCHCVLEWLWTWMKMRTLPVLRFLRAPQLALQWRLLTTLGSFRLSLVSISLSFDVQCYWFTNVKRFVRFMRLSWMYRISIFVSEKVGKVRPTADRWQPTAVIGQENVARHCLKRAWCIQIIPWEASTNVVIAWKEPDASKLYREKLVRTLTFQCLYGSWCFKSCVLCYSVRDVFLVLNWCLHWW